MIELLMRTAIFTTALLIATLLPAEAPTPSITVPCRVLSVHDGDTVTVEVTMIAQIRLKDCWAPELRDPGGIESRDAIKGLEGRSGRLFIDLAGIHRLDGAFSFGRLVGDVYVDGNSIAKRQVSGGFATESKEQKQ